MTRKTVKFIHEGRYAAEVPVELIEDDAAWSPYLSMEDANKLAPSGSPRAEVKSPKRYGDRVFELTPIST